MRELVIVRHSGDTLFDIRLNPGITVLNDLSGRGKTAFTNFVSGPSSRYRKITKNSYSSIVVINDLLAVPSSFVEGALYIADEVITMEWLAYVKESVIKHDCDFILICRDDLILQKLGIYYSGNLVDEGGVLRIKYNESYTAYTHNSLQQIDKVYMEDTTSGKDIIRMLLPEHVIINDNIDDTMGYIKLGNLFRDNKITGNNLFVMTDSTTYGSIRKSIISYFNNKGTAACVYTPTSTEEIVLHCPLFRDHPNVIAFLQDLCVPDDFIGTEESYALYLITTSRITPKFNYKKSKNHLDWRLFTQESLSAIASILPNILRYYVVNFTPHTNEPIRDSMHYFILSSATYQKECKSLTDKERRSKAYELIDSNPTIIDPNAILSVYLQTEELSLFELLDAKEIVEVLKAKELPIKFSTLMSILDPSKKYSISSAIDFINRSHS